MGAMTNLTDACTGCPGRCCTRRFWGAVHLTKEEGRDPRFKGMIGVNSDGDPTLVMGKTACHFLDRKTGHCKIYETRPMACRGYVCHAGGAADDEDWSVYGVHSDYVIHQFPALRRHLKRLGLLPDKPNDDTYFYVRGTDSAEWHLRDLRGHKDAKVVRYSARKHLHRVVGEFDEEGKFHRTQT